MKRKKRLRRNDAGVTLLELMFAAGVMAMALSMVFGSLISITVIARLSEERTTAATELASVIEELRNTPRSDVLDFQPAAPYGPGANQAIVIEFFNEAGEAVALPADAPLASLPNPARIRARMIWEDNRGRIFEQEIQTQIGW